MNESPHLISGSFPLPSEAGSPSTAETAELNPTVLVNDPNPTGEYVPGDSGAAMDGGPPVEFGRYRIERELGRGGMGRVYLAHDRQLERRVALKVPFFRQDDDRDIVERFYREARTMATVQHTHLCPIYDVGQFEQWHFLTMAFIDGRSLSELLKENAILPTATTVTLLGKVARALHKAHQAGIVHRDLKPANIMIRKDGEPVIMDFGLARRNSAVEAELTHSGAVFGTPSYMSPEQVEARRDEIGPATDVWAMGVMLYQMACGQKPFHGTPASIFGQIVSRDPTPPSQCRGDVHPLLDAICLKAIAKSPSQRHRSADDFAADLERLLTVSDPELTIQNARDGRPEADSDFPSASRLRREAEVRQVTVALFNYDNSDQDSQSPSGTQAELLNDQPRKVAEFIAARVASFGGVVVRGTGQETLACFGYPIAYEDSAQRAVRSALLVMRDLTNSEQASGALPSPRQSWVVIHSGEAVAEDVGGSGGVSLVGDARNTAVRLDAVAEPGTILLSTAAHQRVSLFFECQSVGAKRLRGVAEPMELFQVLKESASRNRLELVDPGNLTPLIGRDTELSILKDRWEQAEEGLGQIVLLIGDAGLGKSRLIRELREHVAAPYQHEASSSETDDTTTVIELRCSQYHLSTGFFPAIEFLSRLLGFEKHDPAARLDRLRQYLRELKLDAADNVALFAHLLGVPTDERCPLPALAPAKLKEKTENLLLDWLRSLVARGTVLFIVEDLHWVDPSTLSLIERHVAEFESGQVLSLLTFRPEFETPWKSKPHQTQIALNRLTKRQIGEMMRKRARRREIPEAIIAQIAERTDGVPLFIEEFTSLIVESGLLDRPADENIAALMQNVIPATLHDLLLARLDRMASNREVIQLAATIGREFTFELLAASTTMPPDELRAELDKLVHAEILFQKGQAESASYIFKHALLQDAAYRSMLSKKRQQCHRRIAESLEARFPDVVASQPDLLAQHFTEAGDTAKAIEYWLKAGQRSQEQSANREAIEQFNRGLSLVMTLPESPQRDVQEMTFKLPLSAVLMGAKGYSAPEVEPLHDRCIDICRRLGEGAPLFPILIGKWGWTFIAGRFEECHVRCTEVIALADAKLAPGMKPEAHWAKQCTSFFAGDFPTAREHAEIGLQHYDLPASIEFMKITQQGCGPLMTSFLGQTLWKLGYADQGLARMKESVEMCLAMKHPFTQTVIEWELGQYHDFARQGEQALEQGRRTSKLADDLAFVWYAGLGLGCQGDGLRRLGRFEEAIPLLEKCLATTKLVGAKCTLGKYAGSLAEALWHSGRRDEAWKSLDEAFEHIQCGERHIEAELLRYRGDFHVDLGDLEKAEAAYRESLAVCARQHAKSYELRTTIRLARLWATRGQRADAHATLFKIYHWFTEGFWQPDFIEAKQLLEDVA
ncbi:MAG: protein kinase domain-containing protein [Planctomycetaceae bacterium]